MKKFKITVNGQTYEVEVEEIGGSSTPVSPSVETRPQAQPQPQTAKEEPVSAPEVTAGGTPVTAPMPGAILDIKVNVGDQVEEGDVVAVLEAMKMENELSAPVSGKVLSISFNKGASVDANDTILTIG